MANPMIRGSDPLSLKRIADAEFGADIERWPSLADKILNRVKVNGAYHVIRNRVPMGTLHEMNELGRHEYDRLDPAYNKTYHIKKYGLAATVSEEMLDDNKSDYDYAKEIGRGFREAERDFDDQAAADLLNNATDTSSANLGPDGKSLLNTAHDPDYVSQSNKLAIDADISESTIESLRHIANAINDPRGKKGRVMFDCLIAHPDNAEEIRRILGSDLRPGYADNDINANKAMGDIKDVFFSPYLTDTDATYITTNKNGESGLMLLERRPLRIRVIPNEYIEAFDYLCSRRSLTAFGDWRSVVGTTGAA